MAGITQTVPHFNGGISEQPDQLKKPGQVKDAINVVPDPIWGLYKRPGAKRITPNGNALTNVSANANATWFHYYRDPTEGSYIGQIGHDGDVRMWNCNTGQEATNYYMGATGTTAYGSGTEKTYLTHAAKEDIQATTIMDTTFIANRTITTAMKTADNEKAAQPPHAHFAYVDLLRTENGRQYALNIYDSENELEYRRALSIELGGEGDSATTANTGTQQRNDTLSDGSGTGTCRGIGTQVFTYNGHQTTGFNLSFPHKQRHLIFRITTTGQNGLKTGATPGDNGFDADDYKCTFHRDLTLLFGGEGWHHLDTTAPLAWSALASGSNGDFTSGTEIIADNNTALEDDTQITGGLYTSSGSPAKPDINGHGDNRVCMNSCKYGAAGGNPPQYRIRVKNDELVSTKGKVGSNWTGVIRPLPTPFDADTAVTAETILGGIMNQMKSNKFSGSGTADNATDGVWHDGIQAKVIGTGLYIYSDTKAFNVEVLENDLMRVMQDEINDVSNLPLQCKHGYIVKVVNSSKSEEDDYYMKFHGDNDRDGPGTWKECPEPGVLIDFDNTKLPLVIQRNSYNSDNGNFTVRIKHFTYPSREVGDDTTNKIPTFMGGAATYDAAGAPKVATVNGAKINKVLFFRNRLAFLSGENVILSRPGTIASPNFWSYTALTVAAIDPIDIACAGTFPSVLFDGVETNAGLLVFTRNQQFLLSADDTIFNPDTVKLRSISTYFYNEKIAPISLGTTFGFVDSSGKYSRFQELNNVAREGQANIYETSGIVPTLLDNDLDLLTVSRENGMVFIGKKGSDTVYIYKYENRQAGGQLQRVQGSWVKWKFLNPLLYHFAMDDSYYFVDEENFLQKINMIQSTSDYINDISITQNNVNYLVHLDNYIQSTGNSNSYNATTDQTTFTFPWLASSVDYVHGTDPVLAAFDFDGDGLDGNDISTHEEPTGTVRFGIYAEAVSRSGTTVVFPGKWGSANGKYPYVGWVYKYQVDFPVLYPTKQVGEGQFRADVNGSLILHRLKLNFGKVGVYETTLTRIGKDDYTDLHESGEASAYHASDMPWVEEDIKTIPVYERNTNVKVTLKSSHPSPATLHSMSWEGDYSKMNYNRV